MVEEVNNLLLPGVRVLACHVLTHACVQKKYTFRGMIVI